MESIGRFAAVVRGGFLDRAKHDDAVPRMSRFSGKVTDIGTLARLVAAANIAVLPQTRSRSRSCAAECYRFAEMEDRRRRRLA
jgi:hypothetical protein